MRLQEDYFDKAKADDFEETNVDIDDTGFDNRFVIRYRVRKKTDDAIQKFTKIHQTVERICRRSELFDKFQITYHNPDIDVETDFQRMKDIFAAQTLNGINVEIKIDYKISRDNTFKMFYETIIELLRQLQILSHREFNVYSDSNYVVKLEYCCQHYDMAHLYLDDITPAQVEEWYLDLVGHNEIPNDERYSYDKEQVYSITLSKVRDQKLHYSEEIPQVGYSKKTVESLEPGEFLYARKNGELTLDWHNEDKSENLPIAQYILTENKLLRFMSLNYMSHENPRYGEAYYPDTLPYGNWKFRFKCFENFKGRNREELAYADGLMLTHQLVDEINETGVNVFNTPNFVTRSIGYHCSPRLMTTLQYRTAGTKPGQWYVPTYVEIMNLFEGYYDGSHQLEGIKFQITENRKFLGLPELKFPLGTILEVSDTDCIAVEENGLYGLDYTKGDDCGTLSVAFLAVKP